jgi:IS5 family transposase
LVGGLVARSPSRGKEAACAIEHARDRSTRVQHYRELIKLTRATLAYADQAATQISRAANAH